MSARGARRVALRLLSAVGTLAFVLVFDFFLFRAVGNPKNDLARDPRLTRSAQLAIIRERGLDRSEWIQFERYVRATLHGDLGTSFATQRSVGSMLAQALPNTLILVGTATLLASFLGPWLGMAAGWKRGRTRDTAITQASVTLYSMPEYWLGMLLVAVLAVAWPVLPAGQFETPGSTATGWAHVLDVTRHAVLPVATLTLGLLAQYAVNMRTSVIGVMQEDFITTARAIGLTPKRIRRRHVLRNAALPVVTVIGLNLGFVFGGVITIEALFSWPGLGKLTYDAIGAKDYPMLQGLFLVSSAMVIAANLLTDLLYGRLDPRIRS
jgi:peptide/nickel transport system permease protein